MISRKWQTFGWTAIVMLVAAAGCSRTNHRIPDANPVEPPEFYQPSEMATGVPEQLVDRPPYRLNVGDVLEIIYQVKNVVTEKPYQLKIEDIIKIQFPYQDRFDQKLTVQGDGYVHCLLLGRIRAEGLGAADLEEQLKKAYARYIKDPELTVVVEAANVKIVELKKAITTAPRGQSRLVPVKPDGTIDLPYVGQALVGGKTVHQAKKMLDEMYAQNDLQEIEVTVQLLELAPKKFYVMGEVLSPGLVEATTPVTLMQALIRSGGPNARADTRRILLVRRQHLPLPEAIVFDMNAVLSATKSGPYGRVPNGSEFRYDMYLADEDVIYVPPTGLAVADDWIDQVFARGVQKVFPFTGILGMNFGYQIYNAPNFVKSKTIGPPRINTQIGP
ncbi:MAG TPA: polysaccharide biosynthesis/export family protein [Phycisphaerae bacterium]|nr:polysaccharide biosynthesis/export family protein [Phycisphaerae bacterium]